MTFELDRLGVVATLNSADAKRLLEQEARRLVRSAAANAPRGAHAGQHVAKSYKSTPARSTPTGAEADVYTDDPFGHLVEWGSVNNPIYAPLRRAASQRGFRLTETPK